MIYHLYVYDRLTVQSLGEGGGDSSAPLVWAYLDVWECLEKKEGYFSVFLLLFVCFLMLSASGSPDSLTVLNCLSSREV